MVPYVSRKAKSFYRKFQFGVGVADTSPSNSLWTQNPVGLAITYDLTRCYKRILVTKSSLLPLFADKN